MKDLVFVIRAVEDLEWWLKQDKKKASKILNLIQEALRNPFHGRGKPEPLKGELSGCWSRRIDVEHRLVYEVKENSIKILACRYHYK